MWKYSFDSSNAIGLMGSKATQKSRNQRGDTSDWEAGGLLEGADGNNWRELRGPYKWPEING